MKDALIRAAVAAGAPRLIHRFLHAGDVAILMYHAVTERPLSVPDWCFVEADSFRRQMTYLKRHFDVVPLSSVVKRLKEKPRRP
ncbi:MAG: polysaccharide deacetylase family protein, partial [Elusimicrobia bacterium]|nr:polysaccharide deacetylase family protein [Elusimicrobiota bacterium]